MERLQLSAPAMKFCSKLKTQLEMVCVLSRPLRNSGRVARMQSAQPQFLQTAPLQTAHERHPSSCCCVKRAAEDQVKQAQLTID
jgi:hypothetical protein